MSNALRKLERNVIRTKCYQTNGNVKNFKSMWDEYHYPRVEVKKDDGNTESIRAKKGIARKKQKRVNMKSWLNQVKAMKDTLSMGLDNKPKQSHVKRISAS